MRKLAISLGFQWTLPLISVHGNPDASGPGQKPGKRPRMEFRRLHGHLHTEFYTRMEQFGSEMQTYQDSITGKSGEQDTEKYKSMKKKQREFSNAEAVLVLAEAARVERLAEAARVKEVERLALEEAPKYGPKIHPLPDSMNWPNPEVVAYEREEENQRLADAERVKEELRQVEERKSIFPQGPPVVYCGRLMSRKPDGNPITKVELSIATNTLVMRVRGAVRISYVEHVPSSPQQKLEIDTHHLTLLSEYGLSADVFLFDSQKLEDGTETLPGVQFQVPMEDGTIVINRFSECDSS